MTTPDWTALATKWMHEDPDPATRAEIEGLLARGDTAALADRFGQSLEFGTAGLRGLLGAGPNRMNRAVVLRTTAGFCAYLKSQSPDAVSRGIVVGYDGRHMSETFADDVARVATAAGFTVHLFPHVAPTPLTAYAVKHLNAAAGVMVTASHNPPAYNGYKVYWGNGAQIIPPVDVGIAAAIDAVGPATRVAVLEADAARAKGLRHDVAQSVTDAYLAGVRALVRDEGARAPLTIAYTALHGVGDALATEVLRDFGAVHSVAEQAKPDGDFPTVAFPNPEEKGAMDLVLALAQKVSADLVLANDPDADRLAVAAPRDGRWVQLTGNEVGALLGDHVLRTTAGADRLVATSIVSSPLLARIAAHHGVRYAEVLTGFKWIANRAIDLLAAEGLQFVFGYEEALGYTVGTLVRDKDGVSGAACFAALAASLKARGETVFTRLEEIWRVCGYYLSTQHNVTAPGAEGRAKITATMAAFRADLPRSLDGRAVVAVDDYQRQVRTADGVETALALPPSDVIGLSLDDGSRVMLRPSGTEPKIKYYFDHREPLRDGEPMAAAHARAQQRLDALKASLLEAARARGGAV